jgi:hypothetical protein
VPFRHPRRLAVAGLALALLLAGAAACAKKNPSPNPDGNGALGTGDVTPSAASPSSTPQVTATLAPVPVAYPDTAQAYAQAVIDAWLSNDTARLGQLTTSGVPTSLQAVKAWDKNWDVDGCHAVSASTTCRYMNNSLDFVDLQITNQLLGKAHAAVAVSTNKMTYPTSNLSYVKAFLDNWQAGELNRVAALSSSAIVGAHIEGQTAPSLWQPCIWSDNGVPEIRINNTLPYMLQLSSSIVSAGSPNGITGWVANTISC